VSDRWREPNGNLISVDVVAVVVTGLQALHAVDIALEALDELDGAGPAERRELARQLDGVIAEIRERQVEPGWVVHCIRFRRLISKNYTPHATVPIHRSDDES
jgi:hypothetical protein